MSPILQNNKRLGVCRTRRPAVMPEGPGDTAHSGAAKGFGILPGSTALGNDVVMLQKSRGPVTSFLPEHGSQHPGCGGGEGVPMTGRARRRKPTPHEILQRPEGKRITETLEKVLTCLVGSIHFPGQENLSVPQATKVLVLN